MKFNDKVWIILFGILIYPGLLFAQDIEAISKMYPNALAVTANHKKEMTFFMQKNVPLAQTTEEIDMLMLSDKANGIYNNYSVYNSSFEEVKNLEAYTKVPDGNKYRKIKVTDFKTKDASGRSVFYDDFKETTFNFPSLSKGAIASVSHTELHKEIRLIGPTYFMSHLPVLNMEFTVSFPQSMDIRYIVKNNDGNIITISESSKGKQKTVTFSAKNINIKERYSNAAAVSYNEPHVIVYVASYQHDKDNKVFVFHSQQSFYKWNYSFLNGINTEPSTAIKQLADSLTIKKNNDYEKAKAIFQWVQEHVKYVAFEDGLEGFIPRQAKDVYAKRYGDCKDMSSLLTDLMLSAGLKAHFTWIGTRQIAYDYDDVHLPITDNHMISTVNIGNEWIFLDATDPNCIFGFPTKDIQGKQALIAIDNNNYKIIRVPEVLANKNKYVYSTHLRITDNGISGNVNVSYSGYFGNDIYNSLVYKDPKDVREFVKYKISKGNNKFNLEDYKILYPNKDEKKVNIDATFNLPDFGTKIGNEYYLNLNLDKFFSAATIDTSKRKVAVNNDYKFQVEHFTTLDIPDAYKVTYLPKDLSLKNKNYTATIQYISNASKVIVKQVIESESIWITPSEFDSWNKMVKDLTNAYKEQIVLQKK